MRGTHPRGRGWQVCLVWLLVIAVLAGCGRRGAAGGGRPSASPDRPGIDVPVPDIDIGGGGGTTGSQGDAGGGTGATGSQGDGGTAGGAEERETEPEPTDATEDAFRAVRRGTCLPVYRDGREWNVSVPPSAVSCQSERAGLFHVTRTANSAVTCPSGVGRDTWRYRSSVTGGTTTLCLNRVWVKNYCVLAEQTGDDITSIGSTTAADCQATRVPVPYNQALVVAGVYRAPSDANASHCRTSAQDSRRYWSLLADGGDTLVCFTHTS